jgi:thymidylate synthase ThyX
MKVKILLRIFVVILFPAWSHQAMKALLNMCCFTFAIEGLSRAASHQLVRHRIASYSQQSQRYVSEVAFDLH